MDSTCAPQCSATGNWESFYRWLGGSPPQQAFGVASLPPDERPSSGPAAGAGASERSEKRTDPAKPGPSPLLEHKRNTVEKGLPGSVTWVPPPGPPLLPPALPPMTSAAPVVAHHRFVEIRACGCGSRFCEDCCQHEGYKLRQRLTPVLATFERLLMVSLTLDQTLFESPEQAFRYVRKKRCLAEFVKALHRGGHIKSTRFVYVLEFQKNGWPHWHLLLETAFIPHDLAMRLWGRHRPVDAGPVQPGRPALGFVSLNAPKFATAEHAANYATKYIVKHPAGGYPDWVLDFDGKINRFQTSRGLLKPAEAENTWPAEAWVKPKPRPITKQHPFECFCEVCRGESTAAEVRAREVAKARRPRRTVREQLELCRTRGVAIVRDELVKSDGECEESRTFLCDVGPFNDAVAALGYPRERVGHVLTLLPGQLAELFKFLERPGVPRARVP